ncbi:MAG: hypothetical protein C0490_09055 [Marivirga sp.]|nr:hypothetical protein [Marivirga sp.]
MKHFPKRSLVIIFFLMSFSPNPNQGDNIEFTCFKMHKASNTCHFNFTVDGAKFRYVDMGCKYNKRVDEVIKKVKDGTLALARDWKIDCPEPKQK